jgi:hypothetical protein
MRAQSRPATEHTEVTEHPTVAMSSSLFSVNSEVSEAGSLCAP